VSDSDITRRKFLKISGMTAAGLTFGPLPRAVMPGQIDIAEVEQTLDPIAKQASDQKLYAYSYYRSGMIKRHIACSGRYLSELWLKEYEPNKDAAYLLRNKRVLLLPKILSHVELKTPLMAGIVDAPFEKRWGSYYIKVSYDAAEYKLPVFGNGELRDKQRIDVLDWFIQFNKGQTEHSRTYVPWLSKEGVIYGGGDNPLLRGGIAMATFAIEYIIKKKKSSLRYASYLLRYFENCERDKTGFLCRCDNFFNVSGQMNKSASIDEIVGLVLGLYYLFRASQGHLHLRKRVRALTRRIALRLQSNGYLIISPTNHELHRGFAGGYIFQWALQQAFEKITGERYSPTPIAFQKTSEALWEVIQDRYVDNSGKLHYRRIKYGAQKEISSLVAIMWLWGKHGHISQDLAEKWEVEVHRLLADVIPSELTLFGFDASFARSLVDSIIARLEGSDLDIARLADPFCRYWLNFKILDLATYLWNTDSWFNHCMAFHSLQFALDEDLIREDHDEGRAANTAVAAGLMIKRVLCGERIPKPSGPLSYEIGTADDDFYAAVIAKGLLSRFAPFASDVRCGAFPPTVPVQEVLYSARVDSAIEKRQRLWDELPAGELWWVRNARPGWQEAPVRWHNSNRKERAKIGMDFSWEHYPDSNRVLCWGRSTHETTTGLRVAEPRGCEEDDDNNYPCTPSSVVKQEFDNDIDIVFEAGGLDYLFPTALMGLWLNEPIDFDNTLVRPLRGVACLPVEDNGGYRRAPCCVPMQDWLLFYGATI
jgi:hypothetical protein